MSKVKATRAKAIHAAYTKVVRPLLFKIDPEVVHDGLTALARATGGLAPTRALAKAAFHYDHATLRQKLLGTTFANPIGLAAGFDKNARMLDILPSVGFGFEEIGTVTARPCKGNPKPRLFRAPNSKSIIVNYGLMNDGSEAIAKRLAGRRFAFPVGISIGPTNDPGCAEYHDAIEDYLVSYGHLAKYASYITLNLSCPNTCNSQPFADPVKLNELLAAVFEKQSKKPELKRPILLKLSPDLTADQIDGMLAAADKWGVSGLIVSNLSKNRENNPAIKDKGLHPKGGMSGKVVHKRANEMLADIARQAKGRFVLVGCGGIFDADDAYEKIGLGASLLQIITGVIYQGPQIVGSINHGLADRLRRDGFKNLSDAVGKDL